MSYVGSIFDLHILRSAVKESSPKENAIFNYNLQFGQYLFMYNHYELWFSAIKTRA